MTARDITVSSFIKRLATLESHHAELKLAIHNKKNEATLENELVTQLALQVTVLWQSFLSDLILSYVEMEPERALSSIELRLKASVDSKFGKKVGKSIDFCRPKKITRRVIMGLLVV